MALLSHIWVQHESMMQRKRQAQVILGETVPFQNLFCGKTFSCTYVVPHACYCIFAKFPVCVKIRMSFFFLRVMWREHVLR